jgi:hypothetical protein
MEELPSLAGKILLEQGLPGVIIIGLLWALYHLNGRLTTAHDQQHQVRKDCQSQVDKAWAERFADWKGSHETLTAINVTLADVVEATRARTEASAAIARSQELSATEQARMVTELVRQSQTTQEAKAETLKLQTEVAQLRAEVVRLRDELARRGG